MEEKKIKLLEDREVVDALVLYFRAKSLLENASALTFRLEEM